MSSERILVIKLGALGDFIQALGPMAAIRRHHPQAHITALTTRPYAQFAKDCGYFNDIWIDEKPGPLQLRSWLGLRRRLNESGFTRVYDLQNNDRSNFYFRLFAGKTRPEWVGTAWGASHRNTSPLRTAGHAFDGHAQTLALAGIADVAVDPLAWMQADISAFDLKQPYVLLVPGCAPTRPEKRWPAEKYARLAELLFTLGYQPVILGTSAEADAAHTISRACPGALNLVSQTDLKQIVTMARKADGAIGNDTGPMHLIAATGCPSLVLFSGASDPARHAPRGSNVTVLQKDNLEELSAEDVTGAFKPAQDPRHQWGTRH